MCDVLLPLRISHPWYFDVLTTPTLLIPTENSAHMACSVGVSGPLCARKARNINGSYSFLLLGQHKTTASPTVLKSRIQIGPGRKSKVESPTPVNAFCRECTIVTGVEYARTECKTKAFVAIAPRTFRIIVSSPVGEVASPGHAFCKNEDFFIQSYNLSYVDL
jgi:hypothetical protein